MKILILLALLTGGYIGYDYHVFRNKTKLLTEISLAGTYCNNYQNRALSQFVRNRNWKGYVMFPPVCLVHDALNHLYQVKYMGWKPKGEHGFLSYDTFYTGKGYNGENVDKRHKKRFKEVAKEIKELLEKK